MLDFMLVTQHQYCYEYLWFATDMPVRPRDYKTPQQWLLWQWVSILNQCRMYSKTTFLLDLCCREEQKIMTQACNWVAWNDWMEIQWPNIPYPMTSEQSLWQFSLINALSLGRTKQLLLALSKWHISFHTKPGWFVDTGMCKLFSVASNQWKTHLKITRSKMGDDPTRAGCLIGHKHDPKVYHKALLYLREDWLVIAGITAFEPRLSLNVEGLCPTEQFRMAYFHTYWRTGGDINPGISLLPGNCG